MVKFVTHVALYCGDVNKTSKWYQNVFGMKVLAEAPNHFAALSFGEKHHDLALVQAPPAFGRAEIKRVGLYHFAVDTGSFDSSMRIYERAMQAGALFEKAIDHRVGKGVYVRDPDLNLVELWSEHYPTYAAAVQSLSEMSPPFAENPIGYPLVIDEIYRTWKSSQPGA